MTKKLVIWAMDGGEDPTPHVHDYHIWGVGEVDGRAVYFEATCPPRKRPSTALVCPAPDGTHFINYGGGCVVVRGGRVEDCDADCPGIDVLPIDWSSQSDNQWEEVEIDWQDDDWDDDDYSEEE